MIKITQGTLVGLMMEKIGETTRGTYNKADPTHYSKGKITLEIEDQFENDVYPIECFYHDHTWVVDFKFVFKGVTYEGSFSREDNEENGEWLTSTPDFFGIFKMVLLEGKGLGSIEAERNATECAHAMGYGIE